MSTYVIRFKKGHNDKMRYAIVYASSAMEALEQFNEVGIVLAENRVTIACAVNQTNQISFTNEEVTAYKSGWRIV